MICIICLSFFSYEREILCSFVVSHGYSFGISCLWLLDVCVARDVSRQ